MTNETRDSREKKVSSSAQSDAHFIWPLSKSPTPDEMNTSFGPRIDADKWDFHDGIDLPAPIGTPVFAMRAGKIFRAGPGEPDKNLKGFHSRHVLIETEDASGEKVYLVYLPARNALPRRVYSGDDLPACRHRASSSARSL